MRWRARFGFVAVFVVAVACGGGSSSRGDGPRADVLFVGDSLLYESRHAVRAATTGSRIRIRAIVGGAPCDFLSHLDADLARWRPRLVVVETVGNAVSLCMADAGVMGSDRFAHRYRTDVRRIVAKARAADARVLIVDPPPVGGLSADGDRILTEFGELLRLTVRGVGAVEFVSGPRLAVSDRGRFVATLPCRTDELALAACRAGEIGVRDPYLGIHFCPRTYASPRALLKGCSEYSSGAVRFGDALAAAAARSAQE